MLHTLTSLRLSSSVSSIAARLLTLSLTLALPALSVACSDDDSGGAGDAQTPPTSGDAVEDWLAAGMYKSWRSEPAVHAARSPSPHGFNRIFVNDAMAAAATATGAWPQGAASVKELYASASDTTPMGYAVSLKLESDSGGGANWYWYERISDQVVADGTGASGTAKSICVGCHTAAGADAAHTPSPGARDQVYTPVQ